MPSLAQYILWTVVAGLLVLAIASFGKGIWSGIVKLWNKAPWRTSCSASIPNTKITFVLVPHRTFWNMASTGNGKPCMQIMTAWYTTNASNTAVTILDAGIANMNMRNRTCRTIVSLVDKGNVAHQGVDRPIAPRQTETTETVFFVEPPTQKENTQLILKMFFIDQYGCKHKTPKIKMEYMLPSAQTFY